MILVIMPVTTILILYCTLCARMADYQSGMRYIAQVLVPFTILVGTAGMSPLFQAESVK